MADDKTKHPFQPGIAVAVISGSWGVPRPVKRVVAKVYKNGNFVLEGFDQQWRPGFSAGTARQAGDQGWRGNSLEVWSDKHDEMQARAARHDQWRDAVDKIAKAKVDPTPEMISAIQDVVTMIEARDD